MKIKVFGVQDMGYQWIVWSEISMYQGVWWWIKSNGYKMTIHWILCLWVGFICDNNGIMYVCYWFCWDLGLTEGFLCNKGMSQ